MLNILHHQNSETKIYFKKKLSSFSYKKKISSQYFIWRNIFFLDSYHFWSKPQHSAPPKRKVYYLFNKTTAKKIKTFFHRTYFWIFFHKSALTLGAGKGVLTWVFLNKYTPKSGTLAHTNSARNFLSNEDLPGWALEDFGTAEPAVKKFPLQNLTWNFI